MPGTPPLGPAALFGVRLRAPSAARRAVRLLLVAASAALALAAPAARAQAPTACPAAGERLGAASSATVQAAVSCLVNAERAARGLVAVEPAGALELSAQRHATDMVTRRYFAHVSPSGGTVDKRARRAGYITGPCWVLGEDLGWAPPTVATAETVVAAWMASPKHRAVILEPSFRDIGIGLVTRAPVSDGSGATFVLELGALTRCAGPATAVAPRARIRTSVSAAQRCSVASPTPAAVAGAVQRSSAAHASAATRTLRIGPPEVVGVEGPGYPRGAGKMFTPGA